MCFDICSCGRLSLQQKNNTTLNFIPLLKSINQSKNAPTTCKISMRTLKIWQQICVSETIFVKFLYFEWSFFYWSSSNWASYRKLRWSQKYPGYVSNLYESLLAHTTRTWNTMVAYAFPFKVNTKWRTHWHTTHCVTAFDVIRMNWNRFEYDWHFDGSYYELSFCKMMDFWWASIINTFYWQDIPLQWRNREKIKRNQELFWNWHCEFSIKKRIFYEIVFFSAFYFGFSSIFFHPFLRQISVLW